MQVLPGLPPQHRPAEDACAPHRHRQRAQRRPPPG